jgi:hypothetical protein
MNTWCISLGDTPTVAQQVEIACIARTIADMTGVVHEIRVYTPSGQFAYVQHPLRAISS